MTTAPAPGSLVRLSEGWCHQAAMVVDPPAGSFTDQDYMGRTYVWILAAADVHRPGPYHHVGLYQVSQSHIEGVLQPPSDGGDHDEG